MWRSDQFKTARRGAGLDASLLVLVAVAALWAVPLMSQDKHPGRELFRAKCAKCHGENGVPRRIAKGAPNFADPQWTLPLDQIELSVRDGKGRDMRPFRSKLDPEQIKTVAEFVQTLNKGCAHPCPDSNQAGPK